ncbi:hypothetical protein BJ508DRAFT_315370 [Ascobolus immersus RN42]|uniref:DEAD/DEAH box helicase domain-containing protein n=1 Tax=Ascobolus immersus RN42 TaxID=1160509 RepID=A0A3N4HB54_ASCIM|nr:hypothetical protein BJ508DRAFT_315370 [Ascobolus immersus RN42]
MDLSQRILPDEAKVRSLIVAHLASQTPKPTKQVHSRIQQPGGVSARIGDGEEEEDNGEKVTLDVIDLALCKVENLLKDPEILALDSPSKNAHMKLLKDYVRKKQKINLHRWQKLAGARILSGKDTLVTAGTGMGKSAIFQILLANPAVLSLLSLL